MQREDFTDETLMAFADGVLDGPLFGRIADALEEDAVLAERLEALVQGASLAKAGYGHLLGPVPPALESQVKRGIAQAGRQSAWRHWLDRARLWPLGIAAVAAVVAIVAMPIGFLIAPRPMEPLDLSVRPAIAEALDTMASGARRDVGDGLDMAVIATFTDAEGALCREFETTGGLDAIIVACRSGDHWQTRLSLATDGGGEGYKTASGLETLDAFLAAIGAGAPMPPEEEGRALTAISEAGR